jgi:hypothetical protein
MLEPVVTCTVRKPVIFDVVILVGLPLMMRWFLAWFLAWFSGSHGALLVIRFDEYV